MPVYGPGRISPHEETILAALSSSQIVMSTGFARPAHHNFGGFIAGGASSRPFRYDSGMGLNSASSDASRPELPISISRKQPIADPTGAARRLSVNKNLSTVQYPRKLKRSIRCADVSAVGILHVGDLHNADLVFVLQDCLVLSCCLLIPFCSVGHDRPPTSRAGRCWGLP